MSLEFTLPLKLESLANQRTHWRAKARVAKAQRFEARAALTGEGEIWFKGPYAVHITRLGKRKLDSDNLAISAKHVRDGIADALGIDDGDETKVTWTYAQEIAKEYGCRVRIEQA